MACILSNTVHSQWQRFYFSNLMLYNTNSKYLYSVYADSTYFIRTTDDWQHWDTIHTGFPIYSFAADSTGQVIVTESIGNSVYNIYLSQHQNPFNIIFKDSLSLLRNLYLHNNYIYLFNSNSFSYGSIDNGNIFFPLLPITIPDYYVQSIGAVCDSILFATCMYSIYDWYTCASFNRGNTWVNASDNRYYFNALIYVSPYIFLGKKYNITRSADGGHTFDTCSSALYTRSFAYKNGVLLAGTNYSGVNATLNKGNTWVTFNDGLDSLCCNAYVAVTDSFYYVTMNDSITYRRSIHDLTGMSSLTEELPLQLYPNPATDYLTIKSSNYRPFTYQIINMQGSLQKEGRITNSQTEINVADLPRGMYILKVVTEKQTVTKKVLLQ